MSPSPESRPCRAFLDDFSAFVDGHLSPSRRSEIQAHVDCCQHCLDHLTAYRRGVTVLRSLEAGAPTDFWARLERRIWPAEPLTVVPGGRDGRRIGRWPGPAVGLAAAAVLTLFVLVRGLGPNSTPGRLGPQRVQASVVLTVPEVPDAIGSTASTPTQERSSRPAVRRTETIPVATSDSDPAAATLARVDSRMRAGFDREIRRLRERVFEDGRDDGLRASFATEAWIETEGWVEPVRLGDDWSRGAIRPAALVRPAAAVMPAPWNVDQAVSLP
jgi:hypothetical protein